MLSSRDAFYWLIVLVTMTTLLSSHKNDKNIFTARVKILLFFRKKKILVLHLYLYNKINNNLL